MKGQCPECHQEITLRRSDMKLRKHRRWQAGGKYSPSKWVPCPGSYEKPVGW